MMLDAYSPRTMWVDLDFSLAQTCAPAWWVGTRSPKQQWTSGTLAAVGWHQGKIVWRKVSQPVPGLLQISGSAPVEGDVEWAENVLGLGTRLPHFEDPVLAGLAAEFSGLRPLSDGSLFDGIMTSIIGQSISVAAAAVTQTKLASRFGTPVHLDGRDFWPLPTAAFLTDTSVDRIRESGVTWRRAAALRDVAERQSRGDLPTDQDARTQPEAVVKALTGIPGIGRWTAESAVLWGVGAPNAHPTGDIALLRAAKAVYNLPELTLKELDALAEQWQPARSLAARLLWTKLFGPAPPP
jgi:3-methyladenine DNA glycosylase/8-oxoguanine DNA glycosylase